MAPALSKSTTLLVHLSPGELENAHGLQPFTSEEPLRRSLLLNAHSRLTSRLSSLVSLRSLIPAGPPAVNILLGHTVMFQMGAQKMPRKSSNDKSRGLLQSFLIAYCRDGSRLPRASNAGTRIW